MKRIKKILNLESTYVVLITLVLSTLLLDYAFGSISLGLLIFVCFLNFFHNRPQIILEYLPLIAIFFIMVLSLFWTIDFKNSIRGLTKFVPLLAVPIAFMALPKLSKNSINKVFDYFAITNTFFALFFFINAGFRFFENKNISVFFYHDFVSIFDLNAIYASSFFLLSYGYLILKERLNTITFVKASILVIAIIMLSSKLIIFLLFLITTIVFFQSHIQKTTKGIIILFLLIGALLIIQTNKFKNRISEEFDKDFLEVLYNDDFSMNFYPWSGASLRLFQIRLFSELLTEDEFLLTGYGVNASQVKIIEKHKKYKLFNGFYHYNFHNQYIQIISEIGIMGLICIIIILFLMLKQFYKTKNKMALFVFLLFSALFFTESYLSTQRGVIHFIIYICLINHPSYRLNNNLTN
jgi:O-antigen ligase